MSQTPQELEELDALAERSLNDAAARCLKDLPPEYAKKAKHLAEYLAQGVLAYFSCRCENCLKHPLTRMDEVQIQLAALAYMQDIIRSAMANLPSAAGKPN